MVMERSRRSALIFGLISLSCSADWLAAQVQPSVSTVREMEWREIASQLADSSATYTEPWDDLNCRTLHGGAYLGNGDLGVHLGGTRHSLVFYFGKNGFHAGNNLAGADGDGKWTQHILNLALLTLEKADGAEAGEEYRVRQDLERSEIQAVCTMAGAQVQARTFLDPLKNLVVVELSTSSGRELALQATLRVVGNQFVTKNAGSLDEVAWVTKEPNAEGAPFYVKGAVAARVIGAAAEVSSPDVDSSRLRFSLPSNGASVYLFLAAEHLKNAGSPLSAVQSLAGEATQRQVEEIAAANRKWWQDYWLRCYIRLGDDVQRYWYNHLYLIGSAARSGDDNRPGKAPGHWGPWNRRDDMMWFSNVSMNYNGQNPYYGTFAANHVDLIDPYIETVKYYLENTGRRRVANRWVSPTIASKMPADCRGVAFELSFTSHGTSCGEGAWVDEDGSMPTNAVFGILPLVWKWKYGRDRVYLAQTCYPMLREVGDFFDDYIGEPVDGRYQVFGAVHEGRDWFTVNDMFSLGSVKFLYRELIAASEELGIDAERREHWRRILEGIGPYHLQAWDDTLTFRPDSVHDVMEALSYQGGARNTGLMFTTTFDNLSLRSLPAYRIATCNTLDKGNMFSPQRFSGWQDSNDFGMMFVMAVRSGYQPDRVIEAIKKWKPEPNGIVSQKRGGGIETAGIVEAINNMLMQSHDGVIRLFPNWDRSKAAQFHRLRAVGAFLVDARWDPESSSVKEVRLFSEQGVACRLESPFPGAGIRIIREQDGKEIPTESREEEFGFETAPGATYRVERLEFPPPLPGAPVIQEQPDDVTLIPPATAAFKVKASGERVHYQWQKNRVDISEATESTYVSPPITLWEFGSEYRCVLTNESGTTISRAAVINPSALRHNRQP